MKKRKYKMRVINDETGERTRVYKFRGDKLEYFKCSFYATCSGCYESNEGSVPTGTPFHPKHNIPLGIGCSECRGRGFRLNVYFIPFEFEV